MIVSHTLIQLQRIKNTSTFARFSMHTYNYIKTNDTDKIQHALTKMLLTSSISSIGHPANLVDLGNLVDLADLSILANT